MKVQNLSECIGRERVGRVDREEEKVVVGQVAGEEMVPAVALSWVLAELSSQVPTCSVLYQNVMSFYVML